MQMYFPFIQVILHIPSLLRLLIFKIDRKQVRSLNTRRRFKMFFSLKKIKTTLYFVYSINQRDNSVSLHTYISNNSEVHCCTQLEWPQRRTNTQHIDIRGTACPRAHNLTQPVSNNSQKLCWKHLPQTLIMHVPNFNAIHQNHGIHSICDKNQPYNGSYVPLHHVWACI